MLFLSYVIGLWFTLRTHAAVIWSTEIEEKKVSLAPAHIGVNGSISHQPLHTQPLVAAKSHVARNSGSVGHTGIRDSQLYKKILGQSLKQSGLTQRNLGDSRTVSTSSNVPQGQSNHPPFIVPPKSGGVESIADPDHSSYRSTPVAGLSQEENNTLVRTVAEIAATAAAVAARDATRAPLRTSISAHTAAHHSPRQPAARGPEHEETIAAEVATHTEGGGHDAPNWSKRKSAIILLGATILYAIIAEILVNTVDVVLESVEIDEKFLGITLFALVPNTTEFLVRFMMIAELVEADYECVERHLVCNEWQHCVVHGDWISLCIAGLPSSDTSSCSVQCYPRTIHKSCRDVDAHIQVGP